MWTHTNWSRLYGQPIDLAWESMRPPFSNVITSTPPTRTLALHCLEFAALTFSTLVFGTVCRQVHYRSIMFEKIKVHFSEARNFKEDTCQPDQRGSSETYAGGERGKRANAYCWLSATFIFATAKLRGQHEFYLT